MCAGVYDCVCNGAMCTGIYDRFCNGAMYAGVYDCVLLADLPKIRRSVTAYLTPVQTLYSRALGATRQIHQPRRC